MKTINLPHVYHTARSMSYDQFEQTIKSDLTGKPITEVIDCTPVVVASQPVVSEEEIEEKKTLNEFHKKFLECKSIPEDIAEIVNKNFWDLLY